MAANWTALRGFWFPRSPWSHRRLIFLSRIVSASITGLDACAASLGELNRLDKKTCRYLRALSKGRACDIAATESHGRSWTNAQLLHKWKVLPARAEIAIRRVKWWQASTEHDHAHLQTMAAIWGQRPGEAQTLTAEGSQSPPANLFAVAFSEDPHLFAGLSGTEDFFELWEEKQFSVVSIFDDEDVRDSFHRTDFKLMRTAAFSNKTLWDTLTERTLASIGRESRERYVFELLGNTVRCGQVVTSWKKYIVHQTHNKSGTHGTRSPLRVSVITNQCVNCGSTFEDRSTAQNHVVNSWTRGTCRTHRSHMTWALKKITHPISCNLCAQEFGDLQTYYAHVRLTHLLVPAPTISENRHAQHARQPRRHRQHSRAGAKDSSRGTAAEAERSREGSFDEPPAEPGSSEEEEEPAARRQWYPNPRETARWSSRRASTRSCSRPSSKRIRRCETYPRRCGTRC